MIEKALERVITARKEPETARPPGPPPEPLINEADAVRLVSGRKEFRGRAAILIVLYFIGAPARGSEVSEQASQLGMHYSMPVVYSYLSELQQEGLIKKTPTRHYTLTVRGRKEAERLIQDAVSLVRPILAGSGSSVN